jgi:hypothetical protein
MVSWVPPGITKRIDGVFPVREPHPCRAVAPSRMPGLPSGGVVTA